MICNAFYSQFFKSVTINTNEYIYCRSSVREFLCSESMYYLGVPTSRAATLTVTNDPIPRHKYYRYLI